jgi:YidC/Oxa1 family membrane protein insertase
MDRNSAIGLTLIAALLLAYFYWFAPPPAEKPQPVPKQRLPSNSRLMKTSHNRPKPRPDSILNITYGSLSAHMKGNEELTRVETADLSIAFSNKGGIIRDLELKNYKTYHGKPLRLVDPTSNSFKLLTRYKGQDVDFNSLYYSVNRSLKNDTTVLAFTIHLTEYASFTHTYSIPPSGYKIGYAYSPGAWRTILPISWW